MQTYRPVRLWNGLSAFDLKCIAVCSMLIDHIGAYLFPAEVWMRYVGRLAFPIYGFLIAEGYVHTRNVGKYMGRLFLFALLSEIPFDLVRYNSLVYKDRQNIFFTLFLALVCIWAWDTFQGQFLITCLVLAVAGVLSHYVIQPEYGIYGILMILCFHIFRMQQTEQFLSVAMINMCCFDNIQRAGVLALLPIWFYNGKKGPSAKYFFYTFYPAHLLVLYLIRRYLFYVV